MDIDESYVPQEIREKIEKLNGMLREDSEIREEINEWYYEDLLDIDSELNVDDELFDATNDLLVKGMHFNSIMEGLSSVWIIKNSYKASL